VDGGHAAVIAVVAVRRMLEELVAEGDVVHRDHEEQLAGADASTPLDEPHLVST
jgi:hypothetical protein